MKASDLFVQCLEEEGIKYIFGVPGEENADLIVVGAQGKNRFKDHILGSTASHVVHKSKIPVLLVF